MSNTFRASCASLIIGALITPVSAMAADVRTGDTLSLSPSETVNGGLYLFGGNISNGGKVNGDLMLGGGNISVRGPVSQDVLAGGGTVSLVSDVGGDVRVGGGNIQILGKVGNDVIVGGGQTQISGAVGGDVVWVGGTLFVDGPVAGSLKLTGGQVTINSNVRGDVTFTGTNLTLGKGAVIDGTLDYRAAKEAVIEVGAVVKGKTTYTERKSPAQNPISKKGIIALLSAFFLGKFLASLLLALVLGLAFKRFSLATISKATAHPFIEGGRGLIALIVLPIASVIAIITIIGIPFGALGLLIFGALCLTASAFASVLLGTLVHKQLYKPEEYQLTWKTVFAGALIFSLLGLIPVLGGIVKFILVLLAVGAIVNVISDSAKEWR